ncbi:MAG: holo-ACP synthase [Treponema sp.]|nr:holo-ACP synthase [Treponema sp.]
MIFGIGVDIIRISRFEKWIKNPDILKRFFNPAEMASGETEVLTQHYAARFAAKEAFSKALGTGVVGFGLKDVYIQTYSNGKPELVVTGKALELMDGICGRGARVFVSLSHEKEYAVANVVIERG